VSRVLLAVDGANLMMRGYYGARLNDAEALPPVVASMLQRIIRRTGGVTHMIVALDHPDPCFRYKIYPGYKFGRERKGPSPADLALVMEPWLRAWGIAAEAAAGFEADDILATLAQRCVMAGTELDILSKDEDLLQCVEPGVQVLWPEVKRAEDAPRTETVFGVRQVLERTGVRPVQIPDWKALSGCSSDSLPGVGEMREGRDGKFRRFGITPKRAAEILREFDCLEGIYLEMERLPEKEQAWFRACREQAYLMRTVARLRRDVPLYVDPAATSLRNLNWDNTP
jgi:5'-3' exonuclease